MLHGKSLLHPRFGLFNFRGRFFFYALAIVPLDSLPGLYKPFCFLIPRLVFSGWNTWSGELSLHSDHSIQTPVCQSGQPNKHRRWNTSLFSYFLTAEWYLMLLCCVSAVGSISKNEESFFRSWPQTTCFLYCNEMKIVCYINQFIPTRLTVVISAKNPDTFSV